MSHRQTKKQKAGGSSNPPAPNPKKETTKMNNQQITTASELQQALINREVDMPEFIYKYNGYPYQGRIGGYRLPFPSVYVEGNWLKETEISWDLALRIYQGETKMIDGGGDSQQKTTKEQDKHDVEAVLKVWGYGYTYAGKKGHGYWLTHGDKALGYVAIRKLKSLIKKNALSELLADLDKKPFTDKAIERMAKELAGALNGEMYGSNEVKVVRRGDRYYIKPISYFNINQVYVVYYEVFKDERIDFYRDIKKMTLEQVMILFS
jgi:hypothetical protein